MVTGPTTNWRRIGPLLAAALFVMGCAHRGRPATLGPDGVERGAATYYSDALAGRATASGERYDPRALTAAHRTLAFGTVVEVRRADGRSVRVRVNDRGPFAAGRVIDLSRRAAEAIGLVREGVANVEVRVVGR